MLTILVHDIIADSEGSTHIPGKFEIIILKDVLVEQVIGAILFVLVNLITDSAGDQRDIPQSFFLPSLDPNYYVLRIVEDDGLIDNDFPPVDKLRKMNRFGFRTFALCRDEGYQRALATGKEKSEAQFLVKVHVYSTLEVKQTTVLCCTPRMLLEDVLAQICKKRNVNTAEYTFKAPDTRSDIRMDQTLEKLGLHEICMVKKDCGKSGISFGHTGLNHC